MADEKVTLHTILTTDGFSSPANQVAAGLGKIETQARAASGALGGDFARGLATVAAGFGAYEVGARIAAKALEGLRALTTGAIAEFNSDTKAANQLGIALTNMGRAADQPKLVALSGALQDLTGQTDDSILGVETFFATLGNSAPVVERLTRLTYDMAPVFGSVEGAMRAVERAVNGEVGGLSRLGISFTDAQKKGQDVEGVIRKLEAATKGQGEAAKTASDALARSFENLQGAIGAKMAPAMSIFKDGVREIIDSLTDWATGMDHVAQRMAGTNKLMAAAQEYQRVDSEFQRAKAQYLESSRFGDSWMTKPQDEANLIALGRRRDELLKEMQALQKTPGKGAEVRGGGSTVLPNAPSVEAAKAMNVEKEKGVVFTEAIGEAEQRAADAIAKQLEDKRALRALDAQQAAEYKAAHPNSLAYNDGGISASITPAITPLREVGDLLKDTGEKEVENAYTYQQMLEDSRARTEKLEDRQRRKDEYALAAIEKQSQALANGMMAAYNMMQAAMSGDMRGALGGFGSLVGSAYGPAGSVIGGIGGSLLGSLVTGSEAHQQKHDLGVLLGQYGAAGMRGKGTMFGGELPTLGDAWTSAIGFDKAGGEKLTEFLDQYNYSLSQQAEVVGLLIAKSKDLTAAEGEMLAARTAILSVEALSMDDLKGLADLYAESADRMDAMKAAQEAVNKDLEDYRKARGTGREGAALDKLGKDRDQYVALLKQDMQAKKDWEAKLKADAEKQGMTKEDSQALVDQQKNIKDLTVTMVGLLRSIDAGIGQHHTGYNVPAYHNGKMWSDPYGEHLAWIQNREIVMQPEQYRERIDAAVARMAPQGDTYVIQGPVLVDERRAGKWMRGVISRSEGRRERGR